MPRSELDELVATVVSPDDGDTAAASTRAHLDSLAKPPGALGRLETAIVQLARIQNRSRPEIGQAALWLFAADHGIALEGVTAWPQSVTGAMLATFAAGEGAINQLCRENGMAFTAVNAGVAEPPPGSTHLDAAVGPGTASFLHGPAMSRDQARTTLLRGATLLHEADKRIGVVGFGDMGLGNTSAASLLTHCLTGVALNECIGPGAGLDADGVQRKRRVLADALATNGRPDDPFSMLATYGGFEIGMITGAALAAAADRRLILVDGFIATTGVALAIRLAPAVREYCLFTHRGAEPGHAHLLEMLSATPLMTLDLCLGEGAGCPLALPLIRSALACRDGMANIDGALARSAPDAGQGR